MAKAKSVEKYSDNKMVKEVVKRPQLKPKKFLFSVEGKSVIIEATSLEEAVKQLKSND